MVATKAFLLSITLMPVLMFGGIFLANRLKDVRDVSDKVMVLVDGSGGTVFTFSLLAPNPIAAGEVFYFTDVEVNGTTIGLPEALWSVTTTTALPAGTTMNFTDIGFKWKTSNANLAFVTTGPHSTGSPTASFTPFTDQLLIFDSADGGTAEAASANLFAIDHLTSAPRGLAEGDRKVTRKVQDLRYTGTQTGSPETLFAAISDIDNWSSLTSASAGATSFHSSYDVTAVPEPSAFLYLLVILASVIQPKCVRSYRRIALTLLL